MWKQPKWMIEIMYFCYIPIDIFVFISQIFFHVFIFYSHLIYHNFLKNQNMWLMFANVFEWKMTFHNYFHIKWLKQTTSAN
jgi:hypothetical protein